MEQRTKINLPFRQSSTFFTIIIEGDACSEIEEVFYYVLCMWAYDNDLSQGCKYR